MKQALTRFLFYLFIVIIISGPFRSSWPDPAATEPLMFKLGFYFTHYGIAWLFWTLVFLSIHQGFIRTRRYRENTPTKELPVPDTQPLERK